MRFAYADPPYLGASRKHYADHPEHAIYDTVEGHAKLIGELGVYDGWALSMASNIDLFPGSGAVTKAYEAWVRQQPLGLTA